MPNWNSLLTFLSGITRKNYDLLIACPHCSNNDRFVKYGFYSRYLFDDSLLKIQRYRCDNDGCSQRTFSILPHAFLRIARVSLCMFTHVLQMKADGFNIADISRHTGCSWSRVQRWIAKAKRIKNWIDIEKKDSPPCMSSKDEWPSFIRDFSWYFYPKRYGVPDHQHKTDIPINTDG